MLSKERNASFQISKLILAKSLWSVGDIPVNFCPVLTLLAWLHIHSLKISIGFTGSLMCRSTYLFYHGDVTLWWSFFEDVELKNIKSWMKLIVKRRSAFILRCYFKRGLHLKLKGRNYDSFQRNPEIHDREIQTILLWCSIQLTITWNNMPIPSGSDQMTGK